MYIPEKLTKSFYILVYGGDCEYYYYYFINEQIPGASPALKF